MTVRASRPAESERHRPDAGTPSPRARGRPEWGVAETAACLVLVVAATAAYSNSLGYPFHFDDRTDIVENLSLRHLWPPWRALVVPSNGKQLLHPRPVVNFSLAANYAMGRLDTLPYHLTNLAIHILAGLTLLGIVRQTLRAPALADRYGAAATPLAFVVAAIWTLHPLQTQAVTYVIQRFESMMGLLYLAALYCAIRSAASDRARWWAAGSVAACLLAMGSKEVAVSLPLVVLLYDRAFLSGSFREAWRRRRGLYLGLAATWPALGLLLLTSGGRGNWAGFSIPIAPIDYARSQFGVILHYLRLCFWPSSQVLDYGWPIAQGAAEILPGALVVGGLAAATGWALVRWPGWGFLGAWFFLILAPTSSIMPIADLAYEHRMYLPLAAVVAGAVFAARELLGRWTWLDRFPSWGKGVLAAAGALAILGALGAASYARNRVYQSDYALWTDVVQKAPGNPRGHTNLGVALQNLGRFDEAIACYRRALEITALCPLAYNNLGFCLEKQGKIEEAIPLYHKALEIYPRCADAYSNLASVLARQGQTEEALRLCRKALDIHPGLPEAHNNLANILAAQGKLDEAIEHYRIALDVDAAKYVEVHNNLGDALRRQGRIDEAIAHYREALSLDPQFADAYGSLALALSRQGKADEAIAHYRRAIELRPQYAEAHGNLGVELARQGRLDEALTHWRKAIQIQPSSSQLHYMLAVTLQARGAFAEAAAHWRQVLRLRPDEPAVLNHLARLLATCPADSVRHGPEAVELAGRAVRLSGDQSPEPLDTLAAAYAETGRFALALETAGRARDLASRRGQDALAAAVDARIKLYQSGKPLRETSPSGSP